MAPKRPSMQPKPLPLFKPPKDAAERLEVEYSGQDLVTLGGFDCFSVMQALNVRNNRLTSLAGLQSNTTLTSLDASANEIETLSAAELAPVVNLSRLSLADNKLQSLDETLEALDACTGLKELNLSGCPVTTEDGYREKVILRLRNIETLDGVGVGEERQAALRRLEGASESAEEEVIPEGKRYPDVKASKVLLERLKGLVKEMRRTVKQRRILMKPDFLDLDRRHEECVPEHSFLQIVDMYDLLPKPKVVDNIIQERGQIVASMSDVAVLLAYYGVPAPTRCRALGREKKTQGADPHFVDYVSFCRDVEPKVGGRDLDNQDRLMEGRWKEKAPAISECLQRLRRDVQVVRTRVEREREEAWKAMASASNNRPHTEACVPYKPKTTSATKLGAWEVAELKKLFSGKDANNSGVVSEADLRLTLREMEYRGRRLRGLDSGEGHNPERPPGLTAALEAVRKEEDRYSWREFLAGVENDSGPFSRLQWSRLAGHEAASVSGDLFKRAAALSSRLSLGAVSGKEATDQEAQVRLLSQLATRLQAQALDSEGRQASIGSAREDGKDTAPGHARRGSDSGYGLKGRADYFQSTQHPALRTRRSTSYTEAEASSALSSRGSGASGGSRPPRNSDVKSAATRLRERFGLTPDVREQYALKRSLSESGSKTFATVRQFV